MSGTFKALFGGSRFVRWTLLPCIVAAALVIGLDMDVWRSERAWIYACVEAALVLLYLAIGWPEHYHWAGRVLCGGVFLAYAGYLVYEFWLHPEGLQPTVSRSRPSAWNAIRGLIAFGLPSLWYALRGRFGFGEAKEPGEGDSLPGDRSDSAPGGHSADKE